MSIIVNNLTLSIYGRLFFTFLLLSFLWGVMAKWELTSLIVGFPSILIALIVYNYLSKQTQSRILYWLIPQFLAWFLWQSLRSGVDVTRRVMQPDLLLNPGFISYTLSIPPGPARIFFANLISLIPGSLCVDIIGDEMLLHVLDIEANVIHETLNAEQYVKRLYGIKQGVI